MRQPTEAMFLKDIATHEMTILLDTKDHRHLRFRRPGTYCMGFDIITWPGYLCISGDMGNYVFSRVADMFTFFRGENVGPLRISPDYWAEKTQNNKTKEYSAEKFRESIDWRLNDLDEIGDDLRAAVRDEVLSCANDEWEAVKAVHEFQYGRFRFDDFCEFNYMDWTYHYLWCCYAVVWAIRQYDTAKVMA